MTGLSKDVIRVWERRYGLVQPSRSLNHYREYSDEDIALLRFVKTQMEQGATIGGLATEGAIPSSRVCVSQPQLQ
ncbi:MAG: MerR family transcriptional regulator [Nitrospira sp.]|nr:MerR family transcriptional regulator [Nitrospira sp.]